MRTETEIWRGEKWGEVSGLSQALRDALNICSREFLLPQHEREEVAGPYFNYLRLRRWNILLVFSTLHP